VGGHGFLPVALFRQRRAAPLGAELREQSSRQVIVMPDFWICDRFAALGAKNVKGSENNGRNQIPRPIHPFCAPGATAVTAGSGYGALYRTIQQRVSAMAEHVVSEGRLFAQQRMSAMLEHVVSEGRLFALKPSEWSMLLGGVMLCGLLTLLF